MRKACPQRDTRPLDRHNKRPQGSGLTATFIAPHGTHVSPGSRRTGIPHSTYVRVTPLEPGFSIAIGPRAGLLWCGLAVAVVGGPRASTLSYGVWCYLSRPSSVDTLGHPCTIMRCVYRRELQEKAISSRSYMTSHTIVPVDIPFARLPSSFPGQGVYA